MSAKETSPTVDSKRRVSRAAADMANDFDDTITLEAARSGLSRTETEEAALGSLAYAFARAIVMVGKSDEAAVHLVRLALAKNRATRG